MSSFPQHELPFPAGSNGSGVGRRVRRRLIVNADDFGRTAAINEGIERAHRDGIVTSASLMVRWPHAAAAGAYARAAALDTGLHIDLGEWEYVDDRWIARYEVVDTNSPRDVAREIDAQIAAFRDLVGAGPTHLDSHQHVHMSGPARRVVLAAASRLEVPVRSCSGTIRYEGAFFGQDGRGGTFPDAVSVAALVRLLRWLPPGVTEMACHPATAADGHSPYDEERPRELQALCAPAVWQTVRERGVELTSFRDVLGVRSSSGAAW